MGLVLHSKQGRGAEGRCLSGCRHSPSADPHSMDPQGIGITSAFTVTPLGYSRGTSKLALLFTTWQRSESQCELESATFTCLLVIPASEELGQWSPETSGTHLQPKETPAGQEQLSVLGKPKVFALKYRYTEILHRDTGCFKSKFF